jgi:glutamine---fructose-6-phosphate transaminase (isomerizing)
MGVQVLTKGDPYLHPRITLGGLEDRLPVIQRSRRIMFVACGTSYHACLAMRPLFEGLAEVPVVLEIASDLIDRQCPIFRDDTVVCVSQSGETADTLAALRYAKRSGALCLGITNIVGSSLSRETEAGVHLNAGYEMGVASTKAYTSQLVVLVMMALLLVRDSIHKRELRDRIADELLRLPQLLQEALQLDSRIAELAQGLKNAHSLLVFGRGFNFATALEAALKVKEIALIHSEGIQAGELKHGPLALIDSSMPVLVIATKDTMHRKMLSVIQQLKARGARLIVVCSEGDKVVADLVQGSVMTGGVGQSGEVLYAPQTIEQLQPVVNAIPMQLLAYHLTLLRGLNVDQPRNLAKSVTVTED